MKSSCKLSIYCLLAGATPADMATKLNHHGLAHYLRNVAAAVQPRPNPKPYLEQAQQLDAALNTYIERLTAALERLAASQHAGSGTSSRQHGSNGSGSHTPHNVQVSRPAAALAVEQLLPTLLRPTAALNAQPPKLQQQSGNWWWPWRHRIHSCGKQAAGHDAKVMDGMQNRQQQQQQQQALPQTHGQQQGHYDQLVFDSESCEGTVASEKNSSRTSAQQHCSSSSPCGKGSSNSSNQPGCAALLAARHAVAASATPHSFSAASALAPMVESQQPAGDDKEVTAAEDTEAMITPAVEAAAAVVAATMAAAGGITRKATVQHPARGP